MTTKSAREAQRAAAKQRRSAARLYSVQALFQMESSGQTTTAVEQEFETHRFGAVTEEGEEMAEGDLDLFRAIIDRAVNEQARIDQMTDRALVAKWPINRIDPTLRALFRAAGSELISTMTPPKVVIVELSISRAPFSPRAGAEIRQCRAGSHGARGSARGVLRRETAPFGEKAASGGGLSKSSESFVR